MSIREPIEGEQEQDATEEFPWGVDATNWGSSDGAITNPSASVILLADGSDVTSTVMPAGSPSVSGQVITLPTLKLLTEGEKYRIDVVFTKDGAKWEAEIFIKCPEQVG